ncbi:acetyl-CoA carboxylase biotin carboxyl carrier protein subunit [Albimonas pacifica]|uniref:Acetyl-CoA carboxylase biotin carboxyl carrier protein/biotin carboxyl carrier protein n=1 Tax=Albimonas pacifica TaxID=1114924 RepID=A0A1I3EJG8_9RHOB|nr:acetyl-CoA carboxylase biotin carboxyl carrier protein subunit [Albimonas pacifica]SFH98980.1 acetyl-CoA carboxylase biotin carboxyl carrier protein/biotin carboxyl carrier protein [Albimonas pacifica]
MEAKSEITGRVLEVVASPGQQLAEDDPIVVLESMKMEIAVTAPRAGTLREIKVGVDDLVEEDQVVALMDPA